MSDFTTQFLKDVERHKLNIVRDDGLHRQLWFGRPGESCMHFQIITWPGYLCYTGDMGTYVFRRLEDMLQFFRREKRPNRDPFQIDFRYWAEKVEAADKHAGIKEFSQEKFTRNVKDYVLEWARDSVDSTSREDRRAVWDAVIDEVIDCEGDSSGHRQQAAAFDFSHPLPFGRSFQFHDFWERDCEVYTQRFLWCCHALSWGIAEYDKAKAAAEVPA